MLINKNTKSMLNNMYVPIIIGGIVYLIYHYYKQYIDNQSDRYKEAINNLSLDNVKNYVSRYFKDEEYFKGQIPPTMYYNNWKLLSIQLDKIRGAFGKPVYILFGYETPKNGLIESASNLCTSVAITQHSRELLDELTSVVNTLNNTGVTSFRTVKVSSEYIYLEI